MPCAGLALGSACYFHLCGLFVSLWHHLCFILRGGAAGLAATLFPGKVAKHTLNVDSEWRLISLLPSFKKKKRNT